MRLDPHLMAEARKFARDTGRTLTRLIEEALREKIAQRAQPQSRVRIRLPTDGSGGLLPGVDLDDSAALLDRMEGR